MTMLESTALLTWMMVAYRRIETRPGIHRYRIHLAHTWRKCCKVWRWHISGWCLLIDGAWRWCSIVGWCHFGRRTVKSLIVDFAHLCWVSILHHCRIIRQVHVTMRTMWWLTGNHHIRFNSRFLLGHVLLISCIASMAMAWLCIGFCVSAIFWWCHAVIALENTNLRHFVDVRRSCGHLRRWCYGRLRRWHSHRRGILWSHDHWCRVRLTHVHAGWNLYRLMTFRRFSSIVCTACWQMVRCCRHIRRL